MTDCELCGRQTKLFTVKVENSSFKVCKECSNYGQILEKPKIKIKKTRPKQIIVEPEVIESIIGDYHLLVKEAREKLSMTQKLLALKLAEKESLIHKIESKHLEPNLEIAKKLEKFLKIKLIIEDKLETKKANLNFKDSALTIGDLLNLKK